MEEVTRNGTFCWLVDRFACRFFRLDRFNHWLFLTLFVRGIDWAILWRTIKSVNVSFLILIFGINIFTFVIRAIRWRYFFSPETRASFKSLFSATALGFMA